MHAPFQSTLNLISSLGPVDVATVETGGLCLVKSIMGAETKDELAEISLGGTLGTEICWAEPLEQRFPWAEPLEQEPFQIQPLDAPLEMLA